MSLLYLSDVLKRAGLDVTKVKLIRHALSDKGFYDCYKAGMVKEYTQQQKNNFSCGYDYWIVFIADGGTSCRLEGCYKVNGFIRDDEKAVPKGFPHPEWFKGEGSYYNLQRTDLLLEMEGRLIIDWGKSTRSWHQKALNDKQIVAVQSNQKRIFTGYENLILSYDDLKDIVEDRITYENWHTALSSVNAIYLIVDTKEGKQYVGSAYGKNGLLGRWSVYVNTGHGNNKLMKQEVCNHPDRYKYFQFSVLQILPKTMTDEEIIHMETLWKNKLMSKEFGMNDN